MFFVSFFVVALAVGGTPHLVATHTTTAPKLDGKLDDRVWQSVPAVDSFVQKFPKEGATPSEQTRLRVLYDAEAVWIAVDCDHVGEGARRNAPDLAFHAQQLRGD